MIYREFVKKKKNNYMLVKVRVKCPNCGKERSVWLPNKNNVKCFFCGKNFKVWYKRKGYHKPHSTIIKIEKGSYEDLTKCYYLMLSNLNH